MGNINLLFESTYKSYLHMGPYKVIFKYIEKPLLVSSGSIVNSVLLYFYIGAQGALFLSKKLFVCNGIILI